MISVHKSETVPCLTMFKQHSCRKGPGHLPKTPTPEGWNNMMKKAAKVWSKIWEENKVLYKKGEARFYINVEEDRTRSWT